MAPATLPPKSRWRRTKKCQLSALPFTSIGSARTPAETRIRNDGLPATSCHKAMCCSISTPAWTSATAHITESHLHKESGTSPTCNLNDRYNRWQHDEGKTEFLHRTRDESARTEECAPIRRHMHARPGYVTLRALVSSATPSTCTLSSLAETTFAIDTRSIKAGESSMGGFAHQ